MFGASGPTRFASLTAFRSGIESGFGLPLVPKKLLFLGTEALFTPRPTTTATTRRRIQSSFTI